MRNRKSISTLVLITALMLSACSQSEVQQFKTIWISGVNAFDSLNIAIQSNPRISQATKIRSAALVASLDPTKPIIAGLNSFPPSNRQELARLLQDLLPTLTSLTGDGSAGTLIQIAAAAALSFFQTESDMLRVTGPPSGASGAPVNAGARLPELKAKLADLQQKVKQVNK